MTKQESIEVLKANYPDAYYELLREAVDMAIEALSEPSRQGQRDGLISLQDAIEAIDEITWYHQNANKDMVRGANSAEHQAWFKADDVYRALESVPSAQPEQPTGVQDILQYLDEYLHPIVSPEHWSVYSELYDMVSMLPSVQPEKRTEERTETHACDLISRQATVDAINALHEKPNAWLDYAVDAVMALPSAQPEIIRCKDCLHWVRTCGDNQWGLGDCDVFDKHLVMCEGYCAWAERRTDETD